MNDDDAQKRPATHRVPDTRHYGQGNWGIERALTLTVLFSISMSLWFVNFIAWFVSFLFMLLMVFVPLPKNGFAYERVNDFFVDKYLAMRKRGVLYDGMHDGDEPPAPLGARFETTTVVTDPQSKSGSVVSLLHQQDWPTSFDIVWVVLESRHDAFFLEEHPRHAWNLRRSSLVATLRSSGINMMTAMRLQRPFDTLPATEDLVRRRYVGPQDSSPEAQETQRVQEALFSNHLWNTTDIQEQFPEAIELLAFRLPTKEAWDGKRPTKPISREKWEDTKLRALLKTVEDEASKLNMVAREPSALEFIVLLRTCLDPVNAGKTYEQYAADRWALNNQPKEGSKRIGFKNTETYRSGPWPAPVIAADDHLQIGDTYHRVIHIHDFGGGNRAHPYFLDTLWLLVEPHGWISHTIDMVAANPFVEENVLKIAVDVAQDQARESGRYRPKRERSRDEREDHFQRVALSHKITRVGIYVRVSARTLRGLKGITAQVTDYCAQHEMGSRVIEGMSLQQHAVALTLGIPPGK